MSHRVNKLIENIKKMLNRKSEQVKGLFHTNCMLTLNKDVGKDKQRCRKRQIKTRNAR